ncbi:hypothetical protein BJV77DRAFT_974442 [Russula vinacea]|nr:hypothetical protein BJV77DRAFT_974442 [Russula vinacea]
MHTGAPSPAPSLGRGGVTVPLSSSAPPPRCMRGLKGAERGVPRRALPRETREGFF